MIGLVGISIILGLIAIIFYISDLFSERSRPPEPFEKRVVLITGGASGVGREMARKLNGRIKVLIIWDINETMLIDLHKELQNASHKNVQTKLIVQTVDVTSLNSIEKAAAELQKEGVLVHTLVNCAGVVNGKLFSESKITEVERTVKVNLLAHFYTIKTFLPHMLDQNNGHIVTIASTCGLLPAVGLTDYCSSKYGAVGFHESLRLELKHLKKNGIFATLVCPYAIDTGMFDGISLKYQWLIPMLRPTDVAEKVIYYMEENQNRFIVLPPLVSYLMPFVLILPQTLKDLAMDQFGASTGMLTFVGKQR